MAAPRKIILHSLTGYRSELDRMIAGWMDEGVRYVGVVGVEAARIEDVIDELCVGDGARIYSMLTASHGQDESVFDAIALAEQLSEEFGSRTSVVEF